MDRPLFWMWLFAALLYGNALALARWRRRRREAVERVARFAESIGMNVDRRARRYWPVAAGGAENWIAVVVGLWRRRLRTDLSV